MNPPVCNREVEVLDAVLGRRFGPIAAGDWAPAGGGALEGHVKDCAICRDVVSVAGALHDDREWVRGDLPVPAAGQVWWRAAVRARFDGTQAAARPLTWAHGVAAAAAAGLAAAAAGVAWPTLQRGLTWVGSRLASVSPAAPDMADLIAVAVNRSVPFALAVAAVLVLAPLVLYVALADE